MTHADKPGREAAVTRVVMLCVGAIVAAPIVGLGALTLFIYFHLAFR